MVWFWVWQVVSTLIELVSLGRRSESDKIRYEKSSLKLNEIRLGGKGWVEITLFNNHSPGDMHEFTCACDASNLVGFATREQTVVERFDTRVATGR